MKPLRIGIIGEFQSGKSLLVNCLLQRPIATVGSGVATTHAVVNYRYSNRDNEYFTYRKYNGKTYSRSVEELCDHDTEEAIDFINVFLKHNFLKAYELIDIPGFGSNTTDNNSAQKALRNIDFALLISSNDKAIGADSDTFNELQELKTYNIPYYFILNCVNTDRWNHDDSLNRDIAEKDLSLLEFYKPTCFPLEDDGINIINFMWYWYSICPQDDNLINRNTLQNSFARYEIDYSVRHEVGQASNFNLIKKLFDMENRAFLELKRDFKKELERLKRELCPIGTIQTFALYNIPDGWLPCDGRSLPIAEYPLLYNEIGITFGSENEDDFKLPNLCGRFVRGWDSIGKIDKHRVFGSEQDDTVQIHSHAFYASKLKVCNAGEHKHTTYANREDVKRPSLFSDDIAMLKWLNSSGSDTGTTSESGSHTHEIISTSSPIGQPTEYSVRYSEETRPKNIALLFCIRYK